jgi:DNA modification methylase
VVESAPVVAARPVRAVGVTAVEVGSGFLPGLGPVVPPGGSSSVPYYESDRVRLYLADAREVLPTLAPGSVDLLCTDPPYGVEWESNWDPDGRATKWGPIAGDDGCLDVVAILAQTAKAIRDGRHVYVFGYRPDQIREPLGLAGTTEIIWDKCITGMCSPQQWTPSHERIAWGMRHGDKNRGNLSARLRRGTVLRVQRKHGQAVNRHPTEKPVELMRMLVESSSLPGDTVLDPFAGSGSTLVAAVITGRKAVGVEVDPRYAQVAAARLRRAEVVADQIAGL